MSDGAEVERGTDPLDASDDFDDVEPDTGEPDDTGEPPHPSGVYRGGAWRCSSTTGGAGGLMALLLGFTLTFWRRR